MYCVSINTDPVYLAVVDMWYGFSLKFGISHILFYMALCIHRDIIKT